MGETNGSTQRNVMPYAFTFSQRNKRKYKGSGRGKQGVECWNVGVLGCWGVGVLEYVGMMEHCFCFNSKHVMY